MGYESISFQARLPQVYNLNVKQTGTLKRRRGPGRSITISTLEAEENFLDMTEEDPGSSTKKTVCEKI